MTKLWRACVKTGNLAEPIEWISVFRCVQEISISRKGNRWNGVLPISSSPKFLHRLRAKQKGGALWIVQPVKPYAASQYSQLSGCIFLIEKYLLSSWFRKSSSPDNIRFQPVALWIWLLFTHRQEAFSGNFSHFSVWDMNGR
jgi:hypothetical protein